MAASGPYIMVSTDPVPGTIITPPANPLMSPIPGMTLADYDAIQADLGLLPGPAAGPSAFDTSGGFVGALSAPGSLPTDYTWLWWLGGGMAALFLLGGKGRR